MEKTIQYRQTMFVFPAILIIQYFKGALFQIFCTDFFCFFPKNYEWVWDWIYICPSSESQGQIVGARESLNGRKNMARRKVKNGEKSPWGQCLTKPVPNGRRRSAFWLGRKTQTFSGTNQKAELRPLSPPLSAPGSPRMIFVNTKGTFFSLHPTLKI